MTGPIGYVEVDDIQASVRTLLAAGAQQRQGVTDVGGGKLIAWLANADGNLIGHFRRSPRGTTQVLLTIDETSHDPGSGAMGDHPVAWFHFVGKGRAWYTNLGHRSETY